jgi:hypothetical protein
MESARDLHDRLRSRRVAILGRWKALALRVYPERAVGFIAGERDRFQNPVGHVMGESLEVLYDGLLADGPAEEMRRALDGIVRIRAVQDLPPSAGVGLVFLLRRAIGEELRGRGAAPTGGVGVAALYERIDRLALEAFDLFMQCREKIYDLRVREVRSPMPAPLECPGARESAGSDRARR